jgi:hypothetical protein
VRVNLVTKYDVGKKVEVKLQFPRAIDSDLLGFGFVRKVYVAQTVKDLLDNQWGFYYPGTTPLLLSFSCGPRADLTRAYACHR